jgi:selenide,water dikinase
MQVLHQLPLPTDPALLVSSSTADDAAVYKLQEGMALVQSVDFFTPIVDDPYAFGQIAAANSLSDIYAMGAKPLFALNIAAFPRSDLSLDILATILKGGADKAKEAGISIVGGHTIDDNEPKYGLVVTGLIDPERIVTNSGVEPGDLIILTKPIGTGIIASAIKLGKAPDEAVERMIQVASALNKEASQTMVDVGVKAATDVTGFGLLGHLREMTQASRVAVEIRASDVPIIEGTWPLLEEGIVSGGTRRNLTFVEPHIRWSDEIEESTKLILSDAQTSGGLLIAASEEVAQRLLERLSFGRLIGRATHADEEGTITVIP